MSAPEFARRFPVERIGSEPQTESIAADPAERAALCARFGWLSLERLEADAVMTASSGRIVAKGRLRATLEQPCVTTGDSVLATVDTAFDIRFVADENSAAEGERELSEDDLDVMPIEGGAIDLGEAVAQTLALALDPYPRSPGADAAMAGLGAEEAGPFAGLKDLLKRG
jgi:uncharacterized metal-binding protein YceD (DUF177 family)